MYLSNIETKTSERETIYLKVTFYEKWSRVWSFVGLPLQNCVALMICVPCFGQTDAGSLPSFPSTMYLAFVPPPRYWSWAQQPPAFYWSLQTLARHCSAFWLRPRNSGITRCTFEHRCWCKPKRESLLWKAAPYLGQLRPRQNNHWIMKHLHTYAHIHTLRNT